MKRILKRIALALLVILVAIQFIPVTQTNPPVTREVHWDSPGTRALAQRACFDCHSNTTTWPWYVRLAPASFLMVNHVNDGRQHMNFSEWDRPQRATFKDVNDEVSGGGMPIWNYVLLHPDAKLSADERTALINGLRATFLRDAPIPAPKR